MKKHIILISLFMVAVLLFTGCESKSIDIRGTVAPLYEEETEITSFSGCKYTNEYFGFKCNLPEEWSVDNADYRQEEYVALTSRKDDTQFFIQVYNWFGSLNTIGKSSKEISKVFADSVLNFYLKNNVVPNGEFSDIELDCLGKKRTGILIQANEGPTPRTSAVLTVYKDGYFVLFQVHYLRSASIEEVQEFFVNTILDHPSVAA